MGPINPLALEEHDALQERHQFLQEQLEDVKASRRELTRVIRAVDREIVAIFGAAFEDVSRHFTNLFSTLFPGGAGRLVLTDPDDPLNTGIEMEARPSGKNVRRLSLLSGGERSLTALAFLFGVFRARPSPFYLMDEVEAALDDVNLHRFLDLVHEFRDEAQLIIAEADPASAVAAINNVRAKYGLPAYAGAASLADIQEERRRGLSGRQRTGFYVTEHLTPGSLYGQPVLAYAMPREASIDAFQADAPILHEWQAKQHDSLECNGLAPARIALARVSSPWPPLRPVRCSANG
jgi:hypothetical protein